MKNQFKIGRHLVGVGCQPYVVAEMSGNHNGDINRALKLIRAAKEAGAHAVKLQTYTADTMTIDHDSEDFLIGGGPWNGRRLYELYEEAHTPWEWHEQLFATGRELGIDVFSSPFDESAVDFLEQFNPPAYKVASFEISDAPLLKKVASTKRPVILSTGMARLDEIEAAVAILEEARVDEMVVLHCVSGYPTPVSDSNIQTISDLAQRFPLPIGLSDHTLGTTVAVGAVALGACFIEKHLTLLRADGGPDSEFSLEPDEFADLVRVTADAYAALGTANYELKDSERTYVQFRRSIYVVADIGVGEPLTKSNIRRIRPGRGLAPNLYDSVLGKRAARRLKRGEPLQDSDFE